MLPSIAERIKLKEFENAVEARLCMVDVGVPKLIIMRVPLVEFLL